MMLRVNGEECASAGSNDKFGSGSVILLGRFEIRREMQACGIVVDSGNMVGGLMLGKVSFARQTFPFGATGSPANMND
jgi:hypothetical protein